MKIQSCFIPKKEIEFDPQHTSSEDFLLSLESNYENSCNTPVLFVRQLVETED